VSHLFSLCFPLLTDIQEFPIYIQHCLPYTSFLTARFRSNVDLVAQGIEKIITDEKDLIENVVKCPPGEDAPELDLSTIPIQQLWAVEVARLQRMLHYNTFLNRPAFRGPAGELVKTYDTRTLHWLNTSFAQFLNITPLTPQQLDNAVNTGVLFVIS
jgi:hypothetical protein